MLLNFVVELVQFSADGFNIAIAAYFGLCPQRVQFYGRNREKLRICFRIVFLNVIPHSLPLFRGQGQHNLCEVNIQWDLVLQSVDKYCELFGVISFLLELSQ